MHLSIFFMHICLDRISFLSLCRQGKSTALSTFYRIARNTASQWQPDPANLEVDDRYWSLVVNGGHHVCVLSASIDTSEHGYGFPSQRTSPLARHPWNLKNLCQNPNSILRSMGTIVGQYLRHYVFKYFGDCGLWWV